MEVRKQAQELQVIIQARLALEKSTAYTSMYTCISTDIDYIGYIYIYR